MRAVPHTFMIALLTVHVASAQPVTSDYDFNRDVRPILSGKCYKCHGPDAAAREAKLRLDRRDAAINSGAIALKRKLFLQQQK